MANLTDVLGQIRQNESGGNYTAQNPTSTASGAYQFVNGTWQSLTQQSGIGTQYATAGSAPPNIQDAVAAYALGNNPNANSCSLWGTCNAAGQVTGPARYPVVDTYDTTPQALAASTTSLGGGSTSTASQTPTLYEGYDQNGTYLGGTSDPSQYPIDGATNYTSVYASPTGTGTGSGTGTGATTTANAGNQPGLSTGAEVGYTPPAATGGPSTVGLAPGVAGQINTIAQNATNSFTGAVGGLFSGVENWMARAGLIIVAVVILLVALWRVMDPSGEKTKVFIRTAAEAA